MIERVHIALYRRLSRGYPKRFRDQYGEDLVAAFSLQLSELGPARCWLRTLRDLAVTVPSQHLERHMGQPTTTVTAGCVALAVGGTMAAVVTGTSLYGLLFLVVAAAATAVAVLSRGAAKPAIALERSSAWKKFLAAGSLLLAVLVVLMNLPGTEDRELSELAWSLMMVSLLTSFTLIGAGTVLGAAQWASRRRD